MKKILVFLLIMMAVGEVKAAGACDSRGTYSNPGVGNGCCFGGVYYDSGTPHKDLTFVCIDGQWYYSGHLGDYNPGWSSFAKDTQLCKKYGEFTSVSSGWYGPEAFQNNNFTKRDKYLMYGDGKDTYCGENKYCDQNQNCVTCPPGGCANQIQNKTVFGFYFDWYEPGDDNQAYRICGTTYNEAYGYRACLDNNLKQTCSKLSVLERMPISGENQFMKWNNKDMYKADFVRMARSGIDVSVLVGWPTKEYDLGALPYINSALDELKAENKSYPKIVLFEALDNWIYHLYPEIDFKNPSSRDTLIRKIADRDVAVWDGIKDEYEYTKDGKKILWLFRPPEIYNAKVNCQFVDGLKQEFLKRGVGVFIVSPSSMGNCNSIDAYHNWGQGNVSRANQSLATAADKYISSKIDVCEVSPGLERTNAITCAGDYQTFSKFPTLERGDGTAYRDSWNYCLNNNEGWIVVQTWNEYFESTGIAPSTKDGFMFNKINIEKVNEFKGQSKVWVDCEIKEECYLDGRQGVCTNNMCVFVLGDTNSDGRVDLIDFSTWKDEYIAKTKDKADFNSDGKVDLVDFSTWKDGYLKK